MRFLSDWDLTILTPLRSTLGQMKNNYATDAMLLFSLLKLKFDKLCR